MTTYALLVFSFILRCVDSGDLDFPPGFQFGAASAAYQIEGAWNISDKSESVWDRFSHAFPGVIPDGANGDIAADSYHHWKRDINIVSEIGLDFYRFSISWTRLLPNGFSNYVSADGKAYYNKLIDGLLARGVEPLVTLYHWDLPQTLEDLGGWTNPLVTEWFLGYAKVVFSLYADRVKTWITLNEPLISCHLAYSTGILAPGIIDPTNAAYLCTKNVLVAHAKVWRYYDEKYRSKYGGRVSIANQYVWYEGLTPEDKELAELANELASGMVSHPIYSKEGGWPPRIEKIIAHNSKSEGYLRSRLPKLTDNEISLIRGTYDFIAFNHYTSRVVTRARPREKLGPWPILGSSELGIKLGKRDSWKMGCSEMMPVYPEGLRKNIAWFREQYGDVDFIITENGYSTSGTNLNDDDRIQYYKEYMKQLLLAIKIDGANVTGYTAWTLIDNFEWMDGYRTKFGLYEVDFNDPNRKRVPRKSALFYSSVIKHRSLNVPDIPFRVTPAYNGAHNFIPNVFSIYCFLLLLKSL